MDVGRTKIFKNESGVSPVIGVILMVAITVILAAVIAAFVFGQVGVPQKVPAIQLQAKMVNNESAGNNTHYSINVYIQSKGGEQINVNDLKVFVDDANGKNAHIADNMDKNYITPPDDAILSVGEEINVTFNPSKTDFDFSVGKIGHVRVVHKPSNNFLLEADVVILSHK